MTDYNVKQVIVVRKDLNMRKGKIAAQAAHASLKAVLDEGYSMDSSTYVINTSPAMHDWLEGRFTKICVSVDSEEELLDIYKRARKAELHTSLIQDAGLTEFKGIPTYTTVAVGPGLIQDVDSITKELKLL